MTKSIGYEVIKEDGGYKILIMENNIASLPQMTLFMNGNVVGDHMKVMHDVALLIRANETYMEPAEKIREARIMRLKLEAELRSNIAVQIKALNEGVVI